MKGSTKALRTHLPTYQYMTENGECGGEKPFTGATPREWKGGGLGQLYIILSWGIPPLYYSVSLSLTHFLGMSSSLRLLHSLSLPSLVSCISVYLLGVHWGHSLIPIRNGGCTMEAPLNVHTQCSIHVRQKVPLSTHPQYTPPANKTFAGHPPKTSFKNEHVNKKSNENHCAGQVGRKARLHLIHPHPSSSPPHMPCGPSSACFCCDHFWPQ